MGAGSLLRAYRQKARPDPDAETDPDAGPRCRAVCGGDAGDAAAGDLGGGEWTGSSLCYWNMAGTDPDAVNVK